MNPQKEIDNEMRYLIAHINQTRSHLSWLRAHRAALEHLRTHDIRATFWNSAADRFYVDFNYLTHPQIVQVMKTFPGHYTKKLSYNKDCIDYTLSTPLDGYIIRAYAGEPPAACKIEETIEYVEVPAHTERKVTRKVICPDAIAGAPPS